MNQLTVDDAHKRHSTIVQLRGMGEMIFLKLGKELYEFENDRCYTTLGYASFNSYLADPDVDISPRTAYRLKAVYKKYILEMSLPPEAVASIGYTKLSMIAPQVDKDNVDEWIAKAETLSRADIIKELKDGDPNYNEPPIVKLLDNVRVLWFKDMNDDNVDTISLTLTDVKLVQQGSRVSVSGRLVDQNEE